MRLIDGAVVDARPGRIINIHPSLLPEFKGLHTHQQALDAAAAEHGASVHFVTADLDGGPVIAQARVPVLPGDDADALRSEEHTSELQSLMRLSYAVFCLKKQKFHTTQQHYDYTQTISQTITRHRDTSQ